MSLIARLGSMSPEEVRFRLACEARKRAGRLRSAIAPPAWRRADLDAILSPLSAELSSARRALRQGDIRSAHSALAAHFASRAPRFPLDPRTLDLLAARIRHRFPAAKRDAAARAERILAGRYDILGYRDVAFGHPPAWNRDPVNDREPAGGFWSSVQYLDPQTGDHKVIWEINRHQHWLTLGRAYLLAGDRRYYAAFVEQLEDWMARNPPLEGVNWASMLELAFRSLSWMWALHLFSPAAREDAADAPPWTVDLLIALDRQLTHVEQNLSSYFSPNTHLSGEALALYVAGSSLPELKESAHRAAVGRRVLLEEIRRQIRPDGGHAELSAHYHRYSTDFYLLALLVARANGDPAADDFEDAARRQANYLRTIADDSGRLPLLGDDDGGQLFPVCGPAPEFCRDTLAAASVLLDAPALAVSDIPEEVFWLCAAQPLEEMHRSLSPWPSTPLADSGYYVSRTAAGDRLLFDAGPHGFLNGGHAHADALSIVLTAAGKPLLADSGTATYTMSPELRDRFRSTAMHNTVVVNGRSQSEPRGPFHWASRARAEARVWTRGAGFDYAEGIHDGYLPIVHARGVLALHGVGWVVIDHLLASDERSAAAEAFWHLPPGWTAVQGDTGSVIVRRDDEAAYALASSLDPRVLGGDEAHGLDAYAPVYGRIERGTCLRDVSTGALPRSFATFITTVADVPANVSARAVPVTQDAGRSWHSTAFRITWAGREAVLLCAVERWPAAGQAGGPGAVWGAGHVVTDARVAFVQVSGPPMEPVIVHGTHGRTGTAKG